MCVLDRILNCLIYIGPILGGANLISHLDVFQQSYFEMLFFSQIPFYAGSLKRYYYLYYYLRLYFSLLFPCRLGLNHQRKLMFRIKNVCLLR